MPETLTTTPYLRVLSLGAGVQSTTVLLMAMRGLIREKLDCAIFSDTGWEPKAVYAHLDWLEEQARHYGIPIHRVSAGNLRQELLDGAASRKTSVDNPPLFVRNRDDAKREAGGYTTTDEGGMLWRKCTDQFKIRPIQQQLRRLLRRLLFSKQKPIGAVEQWFGISREEQRRVRLSREYWIAHRYPFIELGMSRVGCLEWLRKNGFPEPPKSACIGCPYHSDAAWRDMKLHRPDEFADAVAIDQAIRNGVPGVKGEAFLHRSMMPLETVDLRSDVDKGQGLLDFDGGDFERECSGSCGI